MVEIVTPNLTWIPLKPTPCLVFPEAWNDPNIYNSPRACYALKSMCRNDCAETEACFVDAMTQERGRNLNFRRQNGIRGGYLPTERRKLEKTRRTKRGNK